MRALEQRVLAVAPDDWRGSLHVAAAALGDPAVARADLHGEPAWNALAARYAEVYAAMCGMVQEWRRRYPLLEGSGNWGSAYGDEPADVFYTELRTSAVGRAVKGGFAYDALLDEPLPHRWSELAAAVAVAREPGATLDDVLAVMPGPDLPTGGELDAGEVRRLYAEGRGVLHVRARVTIEDGTIVVRDGVWGVPFDAIVEAICQLPREDLLDAVDAGACRLDVTARSGAVERLHAAVSRIAQRALAIDLGAPLLDHLRAIRELPVVVDDARRTAITTSPTG